MTLRFVPPVAITDAILVSSTRAENDYTAWNGATAYVVGNRVIRTTPHMIYERLVNGTTATAPESDAVNWFPVGATNRWAMFDKAVGSITSQATPLTVVLDPGFVDSLTLLDVDGTSVVTTMTDGAGGAVVYTNTTDMTDTTAILDYYMYYTAPITPRTSLLLSDLPPYTTGRLTVSIINAVTSKCGTLVVGTIVDCGVLQYGVKIGITDYSKKVTDAYGVTTVTARSYSKRIEGNTEIANTKIDYIAGKLAGIRGTPVIWWGDNTVESLNAYGFCKDWGITVAYPRVSLANITIEGLV